MIALLAAAGSLTAAEPELPGQIRSTYVPRNGVKPTNQEIIRVQAKETAQPTAPPVAGGDALRPPILGNQPRSNSDIFDGYVRLETPGREKVFGARETEKELEQRFSQLEKDAGRDRVSFPEKPSLTTDETSLNRQFAPQSISREPAYVVYRRLYFEEKNAERYGWNLGGALQPAVSVAYFFSDTIFFPKHLTSYNCRRFDTNAGLCLPGDPVPYLLYPPEFTLSGTLLESALVVGIFTAIP